MKFNFLITVLLGSLVPFQTFGLEWSAVDLDQPCESQLSTVFHVDPYFLPLICNQVRAGGVKDLQQCADTLVYQKVTEDAKVGKEICTYLQWHHRVYTGGYCIDALLKFKSDEGHRAVSNGTFQIRYDTGRIEKVAMTERQVAINACLAHSDQKIACALGRMGDLYTQDPHQKVSDVPNSWKERHVIDALWDNEDVRGSATRALVKALGLCR